MKVGGIKMETNAFLDTAPEIFEMVFLLENQLRHFHFYYNGDLQLL